MLPVIIGIIVFALDQGSKWFVSTRLTEWQEYPVIHGFFSLQYLHNPGAAFGMLAHQQWLFITVSLGAIVAILWFMRHPDAKKGIMPWAMGCLLGGSAGNLIDRVRFGKVVDFFLFFWKDYTFPNFNVADIAITVGVGLFILHLMVTGEKQRSEGI